MRKCLSLLVVLVLLIGMTSLTSAGVKEGDEKYFISENVDLSFFCELSARTAMTRSSHNEVPIYQIARDITGVNVDFKHPPAGQADEQFNLMLASGDLTDIIYWDWLHVPGGPQKAIDDGVIIPLNDLIAEYAPHIKNYLLERPDILKEAVTDTGQIYMVPFLRPALRPDGAWQRYSLSLQFRYDWLQELGLDLPQTLDDVYKVLVAFKNKGDDIIPYTSVKVDDTRGIRWFMGAWGMNYDFYRADGEVHYGPYDPEYKEFLQTMKKWYDEGLIDPDFMANDYQQFRSKITSNRVGAYWGLLNSDMGGISGMMLEDHPDFKLMSAPWPTLKSGQENWSFDGGGRAPFTGSGAAIASTNKNPVETIKWLDFWWTQRGHILANFGEEGVVFNWTNDGFPKYTELVTDNPEGLSPVYALSKYAADGGGGRFWRQDDRYWEQMMALSNQFESGKRLASTSNTSRQLPAITPTGSESRELASILAEVNTYRDEMFANFITGRESLDNFDKYRAQLKAMGVERAIEINQAALDRFMNRPVPVAELMY